MEFTDAFHRWWSGLASDVRVAITARVTLLEERGATLGFPYSSGVLASRHAHMRELRLQCHGRPYRVLYAFDPRRIAILLIGGDKTGDNRFYETMVPRADGLYDEHLSFLAEEDLI